MNEDFIPVSPFALVGIFAGGFMMAEAIEDFRHGLPIAGEIFVGIMFLLIAKEGIKRRLSSGTYRIRWCVWQKDADAERAPAARSETLNLHS